ncbi:unnamed protein product, partial [Callosobruchus maculatus]
TLYKTE